MTRLIGFGWSHQSLNKVRQVVSSCHSRNTRDRRPNYVYILGYLVQRLYLCTKPKIIGDFLRDMNE